MASLMPLKMLAVPARGSLRKATKVVVWTSKPLVKNVLQPSTPRALQARTRGVQKVKSMSPPSTPGAFSAALQLQRDESWKGQKRRVAPSKFTRSTMKALSLMSSHTVGSTHTLGEQMLPQVNDKGKLSFATLKSFGGTAKVSPQKKQVLGWSSSITDNVEQVSLCLV